MRPSRRDAIGWIDCVCKRDIYFVTDKLGVIKSYHFDTKLADIFVPEAMSVELAAAELLERTARALDDLRTGGPSTVFKSQRCGIFRWNVAVRVLRSMP